MCTIPVSDFKGYRYSLFNDTFSEYAFISGVAGLGCINLGLGFVKQKIALFTLRAISGICK